MAISAKRFEIIHMVCPIMSAGVIVVYVERFGVSALRALIVITRQNG